jgi:hypothetical protein
VTPNLYGNLVANTAAGIAGGTGVMPGGRSILNFRAHILIVSLSLSLSLSHTHIIPFVSTYSCLDLQARCIIIACMWVIKPFFCSIRDHYAVLSHGDDLCNTVKHHD